MHNGDRIGYEPWSGVQARFTETVAVNLAVVNGEMLPAVPPGGFADIPAARFAQRRVAGVMPLPWNILGLFTPPYVYGPDELRLLLLTLSEPDGTKVIEDFPMYRLAQYAVGFPPVLQAFRPLWFKPVVIDTRQSWVVNMFPAGAPNASIIPLQLFYV